MVSLKNTKNRIQNVLEKGAKKRELLIGIDPQTYLGAEILKQSREIIRLRSEIQELKNMVTELNNYLNKKGTVPDVLVQEQSLKSRNIKFCELNNINFSELKKNKIKY